ncbi:MAG: nucleotidyltransferase domain-containing protein [Bacteroidetes bacterium]|nr:nucleotidyltransferase domain-containing protein [Bacteroidota bacterium]
MEVLEPNTIPAARALTEKQSAIIKTLLYFSIFRYPLTVKEIYENCQHQKITLSETETELSKLVQSGYVSQTGQFYYVNNDVSAVDRRIKGNKLAEKYLLKARRYTKLISRFPFVEAVFLSGSLSKGYVDEEGDIDYFIITKPGRLWLCRTLLVTFKKVFLLNSHKYFCVNYFIDSKNLEVPDKNIFTATELVFARPMYNKNLCSDFFEANQWKDNFYPNKPVTNLSTVPLVSDNLLKKINESLFKGSLGEKLDQWCFKFTLAYWKKKFSDFDESTFDLNVRSRKNVSKHHPNGFQQKVLKAHEESIKAFNMKNNIGLVK